MIMKCVIGLMTIGLASAHMELSWPYPLRSKFDPQSTTIDYSMTDPLKTDGESPTLFQQHMDHIQLTICEQGPISLAKGTRQIRLGAQLLLTPQDRHTTSRSLVLQRTAEDHANCHSVTTMALHFACLSQWKAGAR